MAPPAPAADAATIPTDPAGPHLRVGVVMTCYNEGPYIEAAVDSVLRQTRADVVERIVIMDDGSGAATRAVLTSIGQRDPRIDIVYGEGGAGQARNRNAAVERCSSPLIAILDGDDLWAPTKLERQLAVMSASPGVGLLYTGYFLFYEFDVAAAKPSHVKDLGAAGDLTLAYFLNDPPILPSTVMMRRDVFRSVGGFDPALRVFEETDLYLRLSRVTRFAAIDEPLIYKRNRATSLTGQRKPLMAHHAFVAFKFASEEPRLLPLVPKRLAERARKLGNVEYYRGATAIATAQYRLAVTLDALNLRAWAGWAVSRLGAPLGRRLVRSTLDRHANAYGETPEMGAAPATSNREPR